MLHLKLVTLSGVKFDEDVDEVLLPTIDGQIGVLTDHMPLVSVAAAGVISIRRNPKDADYAREFFAITGGAIQVEKNNLTVLVDEADHADDISEAEAEEAHMLAQKMKAEAKDQVSLEHAQSMVDRSAVRLHVAGLKRRHHRRQT